jgi:putative ABC transport system permease protein
LLETLALAILAALLAGLYPIWRMAHARPADALRTE